MNILNMNPRKTMDFWKYNDDGTILASCPNGTYEFDPISSFVWEKCTGQNSVAQIISDLAKTCNMEDQMNIIQNDIIHLLDTWKNDQLIILNYNPLHAFTEYDEDTLYNIETTYTNADLLLINPPSPNPITGKSIQVQKLFPLGIGYISAVLKKSGYKVDPANLWITQMNEKSIKALIQKTNPKVLGVSAMTDNFLNGIYIANLAKEVKKDIVVIFGGPHVTFTDQESLEKYPVIDVIVRNEGEYTMLELMDYYLYKNGNLAKILGITFRDNNQIVRNPNRPFIKNLDELPIPDRGKTDPKTSVIGIQTSRGCPGACIFCVASTMSGGKVRVRSAENVVDEIEYLYEQGARHFFIQDDTLTVDVNRLYEILSLIKKRNLDISWSAESRVDIVDIDKDVFNKMAEAGCIQLQFGVEAGSQESLDKLNKQIKVSQIFEALDLTKKAGMSAICTMLMGHPYDTEKTISESMVFAEKLTDQNAFVIFSIVCPYPGTQIRSRADKFKVRIHETSYNDYYVSNAFMETEKLTAKQIRTMYYDGMKNIIQIVQTKNPKLFEMMTFMGRNISSV